MDESEELLFDDTQSDYDEVACDTIDGDILFRTDDDDSDLFLDDEYNDDNESILLPDDSGDESDIFYPFEDVPGGAFPPQQSINFGEEMKIVEPGGAAHTKDRHWVIDRVEGLLENIVDGLLHEAKTLTITLKSRTNPSKKHASSNDDGIRQSKPKSRNINFPGATTQEAWNFTVLLRILELVHDGLVNDIISTKRDLYYRHPDLFIKQTVVDRYVDDLACTFGISRTQLNVTAASKGLVAGCFTIVRGDGYHIEGRQEMDGILVPNMYSHDRVELDSLKWVVVVEKEATFRSILGSPQWKILVTTGMVLTAKGYPDLVSRKFLRRLTEQAPDVPIYALVDLDPDGIAILSTYKYGSTHLAHEETAQEDTVGLCLPNIRWLGVQSHHLDPAIKRSNGMEACREPQLQGWMQLTPRDRAKAIRMLEWSVCSERGAEPVWRQELQNMLKFNRKAEMQILDELQPGLVQWLANALLASDSLDGVLQSGTTLDDGMLF